MALAQPGASGPWGNKRAKVEQPPPKIISTTTVKTKSHCGVILRLRIPGTVPGGCPEYPDPLSGGFVIEGMKRV